MSFSSPDDFNSFITDVRRELEIPGFSEAADTLATVQATAFTTSSEWLGELGVAVSQIRNQSNLTLALDRRLATIMEAVRAAWP